MVIVAGVGAQVVQAQVAGATSGPLSLTGVTAPTDISSVGPFSISGEVDNADLSPSTSVQVQVDVDSSGLPELVDAGMLAGTCVIGGGAPATVTFANAAAGHVTASCPTAFNVPASGSETFTLSFGLSAPSDDAGSLAATIQVVHDDDASAVEATSAVPMTVHHAPALTVTTPASADDTPTAFSGTLDNTGGVARTARLDVAVTDDSGMGSVTPGQISLDCALTPNGGAAGTSQPVTLSGTSVALGLTGSCPAASGYPLAADEVDAFDFHVSFSTGVPSTGKVKLTFSLVALDAGGSPLSPALASTAPQSVTAFPPPTATTTPPAVIATGAAPKSYGGSIDDPANGRDYSNIRMGLTLVGPSALPSTQVHVSCDGGASAVALAGTGTITGQCTPAQGTSISRGGSLPQAFQLCVDGGAPTGTLSLRTSVLDASQGNAVLSSEPAHTISLISGKNGAGDCSTGGATLVWSGPSGGDWADPDNWDGGVVPGVTDTAVVPPASSITNVSGGVDNLVVDGGTDAASAASLAIAGALDVATEADFSGFSVLTDDPGLSTSPGLTVHALFHTASGSNLELGNDVNLVLLHTALATLGSSTNLHRPATPPDTGSAPAIEVSGTVQPSGTATLNQVGLQVAGDGVIDAHGATLVLNGPSASSLAGGATLKDTSTGGGIVQVGNQAELSVGGTTTVLPGVILQLATGSTLTDAGLGAMIDGAPTGSATPLIDWEGGTLAGDLTIGQTVAMFGLASTDQKIAQGATLTNLGTLKLQATGGQGIEIEGTVDNKGAMTIRPGVNVFGTSSSSPSITNEAGATFGLEAPVGGGQPNSTPATISGVAVNNLGALTLPTGELLRVRTAVATLGNGSNLTGGGTPSSSGSGSVTPGTFAIGSGASAHLAGAVTMQQNAVLALDDVAVSGANAPVLNADTGSKLLAPTGATAVAGVLHWCAGKVGSSLVTGTRIKVEIGVGAAAGSCLAASSPAVSLGQGTDSSHRHVFEIDGPATVNNATVFAERHSQLYLNGTPSSFGGGATFDHTGASVDDQLLHVGKQGQLSMPSLQLPSLFTTTHPTVKVPFAVDGRMTIDSPLVLNAEFTNRGTTYVAATTTATKAFTNTDTLTIFTSTLNARAGYTQSAPSGANAPAPVTQLNDAQAKLTTADTATPPHLAPVTISQGGFVGGGTVTASKMTMGKGFLRPSPFNNGTVNTMTIHAPLVLSKSSDVQFILYKSKHDLLKVSGHVTVTGRITGFTGTGYTPAYLRIVKSVMTFPSHTGKFTATSWGGTPVGLGWKPLPLASGVQHVDMQLVDVAPPALGIASIPAFTEFGSQRVTYFAVDNRTGVKSFDVRWRRGSSTQTWSSWHRPAAWQHTTATSETLTGLDVGWEYCFSMRARDKAGNVTPWSQPLCTQRMYDDTQLGAAGGWTRATHKTGFYKGTYAKSSHRGATLSRSGTHSRIAVTAYHCGGCGVLGVYDRGTLIKTLDLSKGGTGLQSWVSKERASKSGQVVLKVLSGGKQVVVDAFGLRR